MFRINRGLQVIINDITLEYNPDTWLEIVGLLPSRNKVRHFSLRRKRDLAKKIKYEMRMMNDCYYRI